MIDLETINYLDKQAEEYYRRRQRIKKIKNFMWVAGPSLVLLDLLIWIAR